MTRTTEPPSQTSEIPVEGDALSHLHRMSRTAGLGQTEYVAVNGVAVAALIFGIGSALVVFDEIFLIIPVVAIVLAAIALRQVKQSNGTQTGRGLSWMAIVVAILCTALLGSQSIGETVRHRRDGAAIASVIQSVGDALAAKKYDAAYALMSGDFQHRVTAKEFADKFEGVQVDPQMPGPFKSMEWGGRAIFDVDNRTGEPIARTIGKLNFKGGQIDQIDLTMRKSGEQWLVDDIPLLFPKPVEIRNAPKIRQ